MLKGYSVLLLTSRPVAYLRAGRRFLREAPPALCEVVAVRFRQLLRDVGGEHRAAREMLLGSTPEKLARDLCLGESGAVESERFNAYVGLLRAVGEKYGVP